MTFYLHFPIEKESKSLSKDYSNEGRRPISKFSSLLTSARQLQLGHKFLRVSLAGRSVVERPNRLSLLKSEERDMVPLKCI